jgi:hypothetical protein
MELGIIAAHFMAPFVLICFGIVAWGVVKDGR